MKAERVVLDTNVLISAALRPEGPPRAVVGAVWSENGVLLFSDETFDEHRGSARNLISASPLWLAIGSTCSRKLTSPHHD